MFIADTLWASVFRSFWLLPHECVCGFSFYVCLTSRPVGFFFLRAWTWLELERRNTIRLNHSWSWLHHAQFVSSLQARKTNVTLDRPWLDSGYDQKAPCSYHWVTLGSWSGTLEFNTAKKNRPNKKSWNNRPNWIARTRGYTRTLEKINFAKTGPTEYLG